MAKIAFIGLGAMGLEMAKKLQGEGHQIKGFDASPEAMEDAKAAGIKPTKSVAMAVKGSNIVINTVPERKGMKDVYLADDGILKNARKGALLIDCSTVYAAPSLDIRKAAEKAGHPMLDAPVSGGIDEAKAGKLSFMVAGDDRAFLEAEPIFKAMAGEVFHHGTAGNPAHPRTTEVTSKVVYKKNPWWRRSATILVLLFLGGNAVFFALIEESIQMRGNDLTVSLELGETERGIFCRGSSMIGLDIDGC